jgi:hypothetical protein
MPTTTSDLLLLQMMITRQRLLKRWTGRLRECFCRCQLVFTVIRQMAAGDH